jgi:anti-anti-sigma regulatory factor
LIERIELDGEYDLSRIEELREALSRVDGTTPVVLDVRTVSYADSSFMNELSRLKTRHPSCPMSVYGASRMMKKLLTLLSFDKLFTIAEPT